MAPALPALTTTARWANTVRSPFAMSVSEPWDFPSTMSESQLSSRALMRRVKVPEGAGAAAGRFCGTVWGGF